MRLRALLIAFATLGFMGIASPPAGAQTCHPGGPPETPSCQYDQSDIAALAIAPEVCAADDDCPAGAYCEANWCHAGCHDGVSVCPGQQICDCRGRCVDELSDPIACTSYQLEVAPAVLDVPAVGVTGRQHFGITARSDVGETIAVLAPEGLQLSCYQGPNSTLSAGCSCPTVANADCPVEALGRCCTFPGMPAAESRRLFVQVDPSATLPSTPVWTVAAAAGSERATLSVAFVGPPPTPTPIDGTYAGRATLTLVAPPGQGTSRPIRPAAALQVRLEAFVTAGSAGSASYYVELRDPTRAIGLTESVVAESGCQTGTCQWRLTSADQVDPTAPSPAFPFEGVSRPVVFGPGTITGALRGQMRGTMSLDLLEVPHVVTTGQGPLFGGAPTVEWLVELQRTGDLPVSYSAPTAQAHPARRTLHDLFEEEAALMSRFNPKLPKGSNADDCYLSDAYHGFGPGQRNADQECLYERQRNFRAYEADYLALATQLERGEPVDCEWHRPEPGTGWRETAPVDFIPCGEMVQAVEGYRCDPISSTPSMPSALYEDILFSFPNWAAQVAHLEADGYHCWEIASDRDWYGNPGGYRHLPYGPMNPNPKCLAFESMGCTPHTFVDDRGRYYYGCKMPFTSWSAADHTDLACAQSYLCSGGKVLAGSERPRPAPDGQTWPVELRTGDPAWNAPGEGRFAGHVQSAGSQDLACGSNPDHGGTGAPPWGTVGLFANLDGGSVSPISPRLMLEGCLADLAREDHETASTAPYLTAGCIQKSYFLRAATAAAGSARRRYAPRAEGEVPSAGATQPSDEDLAADALYLRLLQQWIDVHAFVAREGRHELAFGRLLLERIAVPGTPPASSAELSATTLAGSIGLAFGTPGQSDADRLEHLRRRVLDTVEQGWDTLLHPRLAAPLAVIDVETVTRPDYRRRSWNPDPNVTGEELSQNQVQDHDEQGVGLPVALLDGYTTYLELVERAVVHDGFAGDPGALQDSLQRLARASRMALAVEHIANDLFERAELRGLAWQPGFERSRSLFAAARLRVQLLADRLVTGSNPVGVEESTVPLFFDSVASGPQSFPATTFIEARANAAVSEAERRVEDAANKWSQWVTHDLRTRDAALRDTQRDRQAAIDAGRELQVMCGSKSNLEGMLDWIDVTGDGQVDLPPEACALGTTPSCQFDVSDLENLFWNAEDDAVKLRACLIRANNQSWPEREVSDDEALNALGTALAITPVGAIAQMTIYRPGQSFFELSVAPGQVFDARAFFGTNVSFASPADRGVCEQLFGAGGHPSVLSASSSPLEDPSCFTGRLGEQLLSVYTAHQHVRLAQSRVDDVYEAHELAAARCFDLQTTLTNVAIARAAYSNRMERLRALQKKNRVWSAFMAGYWNTLGAVASSGPGLQAAVGGAIGAGATISGTLFANQSADIEIAMAEARDARDDAIAAFNGDLQMQDCFRDMEGVLNRLDTQMIQVGIAQTAAVQAHTAFDNRVAELGGIVAAGRARQARLQHDPVTGQRLVQSHEPWLERATDDALEKLQRQMTDARRKVLLALLALRYELPQGSSGWSALRRGALGARHPSQLRAVLVDIQNAMATAGPPQDPARVLSLCRILFDDGLGVPGPGGFCTGPMAQRFRELVSDPAHASYDQWGQYRGQILRFSLTPSATDQTHNCGERIWDMAVSIQGGGLSATPVVLAKKNTFGKQVCGHVNAPNDPVPMKWGSTAPCIQPFLQGNLLDLSGSLAAGGGGPSQCSTNPFTYTSAFQSFPNVDVTTLADASYQTNLTHRFTGRGVWGEYFVLIPAAEITPQLLNNIADIYIRFQTIEDSQAQPPKGL